MIKGKKVGLRSVEKEDLILLKEWRNNPHFRKNFREVRELSTLDQEYWFESLSKTKNENFMFVLVDLKTNKVIGAAGLLYINWIIRSADFSFYIGDNDIYIGDDDVSKESVSLLLDFSFNILNLNKVWIIYNLYSFKLIYFI